MDRSRMAQGLAVILVLLTVGLVFFSRVSEAVAQTCLDGRYFKVTVISCEDNKFPDFFCFTDGSMTVVGLECDSGSAKIKCSDSKAKFEAKVSSVFFKGKVQGNTIKGTAVGDDCKFTFKGKEILVDGDDCPCPTSLGAQEETNPYLP